MDLRQTKEYGEYLKKRGWVVEKVNDASVFIKKLPLVPLSVMKIQRFEGELDREEWGRLKRKYRVIMSVIEPLSDGEGYEGWGYRKSKSPYLPTKTMVVDLRKSEKNLLGEMTKDARQWIKKNDDLKVKSLKIHQLKSFWEQWKKWGKGYIPNLETLEKMMKAFGKKGWIMSARRQLTQSDGPASWLAGMVVLQSKDSAFYYYAWTSEKGRKMGGQYRLVWEGMMRAKRTGLKYWDFEGIEDSRMPRKSWQGFSLFKKKFGGREIVFPGSWQRWL